MLKCLCCLLGVTASCSLSAFTFEITNAYALGKTCNSQEQFSLAVHGGAVWGNASHVKKEAFIKEQLSQSRVRLQRGDKAIDIVEDIIAEMEDSGLFNAGKGSVANQDGEIEMDASIMDGKHLRAGSVASIRELQNPISAARMVMDETPIVMMAGSPADKYLKQLGAMKVDQSYFLHSAKNFSDITLPDNLKISDLKSLLSTPEGKFVGIWGGVLDGKLNHVVILNEVSTDGAEAIVALGSNEDLGIPESSTTTVRAKFLNNFLIVETSSYRIAYRIIDSDNIEAMLSTKNGGRASGKLTKRPELINKSGTVGVVAMDRCGNLAAGTSTGGFNSKIAGRVGDSPIIGAGTYADNRSVAVSATGHGEYFIRYSVAHEIAARIRHGKETLVQAAYRVVFKELKNNGGEGGVIAVDKNGEVIMLYNTDGMVRGRTTDKFQPKVETYSSE